MGQSLFAYSLLFPETSVFIFIGVQIAGIDFLYNPVPVRSPQVGRKFSGIPPEALGAKVLADAGHVAQEDRPGSRIRVRLDHLGEVDQRDITFPV